MSARKTDSRDLRARKREELVLHRLQTIPRVTVSFSKGHVNQEKWRILKKEATRRRSHQRRVSVQRGSRVLGPAPAISV